MRSTLKYIGVGVLTVLGAASLICDKVHAESVWHSDMNGWWYQEDNWYPANQWYEVGGDWYYFGSNGYMETSTYRDGCWIGSSGAWDQSFSGGHWASDSVGYWYTDNSGWYPASTWLWIDGNCYYFKSNGYMAANEWVENSFVGSNGAWIPGKVKTVEGNANKDSNKEASKEKTSKESNGATSKNISLTTAKTSNNTNIQINWDFGTGTSKNYDVDTTLSIKEDVDSREDLKDKNSENKTTSDEVHENTSTSSSEMPAESPASSNGKVNDTPVSNEIVNDTPASNEVVDETPTSSIEVDEEAPSFLSESIVLTAEGKEAALRLAWNPISTASGYRVYLGNDKSSLSQVAMQTSREDVAITFGYMTAGTYYAKVVGYKEVNGSRINIVESDVVRCVVTSKPKTTQPAAQDPSGSTTPATTPSSQTPATTPATTPSTTPTTSPSDSTTPSTSTTTPTTPSVPAQQQVTVESNESIIKNVFAKTNEIRRSVGKKELQTSAVLSVIAQKRAEHMVQNNYFSHYYNGQRQVTYWRDYYGYSKNLIIGENIAKVYPGENTSGVAMNAWVNSPGHYSNIIDSDYVTTGIGVAEYGDGMYAIVQVFSGGSK